VAVGGTDVLVAVGTAVLVAAGAAVLVAVGTAVLVALGVVVLVAVGVGVLVAVGTAVLVAVAVGESVERIRSSMYGPYLVPEQAVLPPPVKARLVMPVPLSTKVFSATNAPMAAAGSLALATTWPAASRALTDQEPMQTGPMLSGEPARVNVTVVTADAKTRVKLLALIPVGASRMFGEDGATKGSR
jgi:hypothetical protein